MSELATRAKDLAVAIEDKCCRGDYVYIGSESTHLIEQALLAERRLALVEALEIVSSLPIPYHPRRDDLKPSVADEHAKGFYAGTARRSGQIESELRAAAEKEVK